MKERFGRPKGPSKEDIEREAERELARLTRNAPGPAAGGGSAGGGFGGPGEMGTPLDEIASSVRSGRPSAPDLGVLGSVGAGPGGYKGGTGEFDRGLGGHGEPSGRRGGGAAQGPGPGLPADFEDPEEERATITELALRDLAARDGTDPDDLVIRQDPGMAEAMRDEAMRRFFDRRQTSQPAAATAPIDPANTVLGRLAARRKAEEEGRTLEEDEQSGGGLLDRVRRRQEAEATQTGEPAGRRATSAASGRDRRGGKGAYEVDDDDDDGPAGLRARVTARRRDEINVENRSARVFAMPSVDDADEPGPVPELAAVASRLYEARAKTAGTRRGAGAKKAKAPAASAPTRARKAKPAAKRAGGTKAGRKATRAAGGAKAASATRAAATQGAARKARAAKAPAKQKAPGAGAKRSSTARSRGGAPTRKNDVSATRRTTKAPAKSTRAAKAAKATKAPAKSTRAAKAAKATKAPAKRASRRR